MSAGASIGAPPPPSMNGGTNGDVGVPSYGSVNSLKSSRAILAERGVSQDADVKEVKNVDSSLDMFQTSLIQALRALFIQPPGTDPPIDPPTVTTLRAQLYNAKARIFNGAVMKEDQCLLKLRDENNEEISKFPSTPRELNALEPQAVIDLLGALGLGGFMHISSDSETGAEVEPFAQLRKRQLRLAVGLLPAALSVEIV